MDVFGPAFDTHLPFPAILARLGAAALFGMMLGLERELSEHQAGLRTHMLVALAAALFTVMAFEIAHAANAVGDAAQADPVRIIEAVTAGVAFLGAGAIIRAGGDVRGLTTGAAMWLAGATGIAAGGGYYGVGFAAALMGVVILAVLGYAERAARRKLKREDKADQP